MSQRLIVWKSLGGILAGIAAVITAVGSLLAVIYQLEREPSRPAEREDPHTATISDVGPGPRDPPPVMAGHGSQVSDQIVARWLDHCFYPASILATEGETYLVKFDFGDELRLPPESIAAVSGTEEHFARAQSVLARIQGARERWVPSVIKEVRESRYQLEFDDASRCVDASKRIWLSQDDIIPHPR